MSKSIFKKYPLQLSHMIKFNSFLPVLLIAFTCEHTRQGHIKINCKIIYNIYRQTGPTIQTSARFAHVML